MNDTKRGGQSVREPAAPPVENYPNDEFSRFVTVPTHEYDELLADRQLLHRLIKDDTSPLNGAVWRALVDLAETLAVRKLRAMSGDLADARDWSRVGPSHAELERRRTTYDRPPRTAKEIRRHARESWGPPV